MRYKFKQKYTERQMMVLGLFSVQLKVKTDDIMALMEKHTKRAMTRQQINSHIHTMANKLALDGYVMKRTSGIGRGARGEYILIQVNGGKK